MRFLSVHRELENIRRMLGKDRRQIKEDQLRQYALDGTLPADELTRAYVAQVEAFEKVADASIGGENYDQAVDQYQQAVEKYNHVVRGVSL